MTVNMLHTKSDAWEYVLFKIPIAKFRKNEPPFKGFWSPVFFAPSDHGLFSLWKKEAIEIARFDNSLEAVQAAENFRAFLGYPEDWDAFLKSSKK